MKLSTSACLLLPSLLVSAAAASPRADQDLDSGWRFVRRDVPDAERPSFDDGGWQSVQLPHTWNARDGQDGGNDYYRGPGWYRRHLALDSGLRGKSLFLKFDGASVVTDVFVNGRSAGRHEGAFGAFCFDVTSLLRPGEDNLLAVKVDNARRPTIPPLGGDFTVFGGLYRDVHLLVRNPVSISPLDYASPGIYLRQGSVTPERAEVEATVKLRNAEPGPRDLQVVCRVRDRNGKEVLRAATERTVPAAGFADATLDLSLPHPRLWNGRKDPYLYRAEFEVRDGKRLVDRADQPLGLRFFRVDPDQGFFLNGASYPLHGVNRHQDRIDKGWAISPADHAEDYRLISELGCTAVRLCHYEHSPIFYDLCDRGGMCVWAELALVNDLTTSPEFAANAEQQLTELIKQNYNHPSIVFWSLFNEPSAAKDAGREPWALIAHLNDVAHRLDDTRLTTGANNHSASDSLSRIPDVSAFNRYDGWYSGPASNWEKTVEDIRRTLPDRAIGFSEYGAGASVYQHEIPPKKPSPGGKWHPEEYQCVVHEAAYAAMKDKPWIWGTFLWNMFDFAVDARNEGDHPGRNDKGLVTYDRKTKKDAFFFYQANWTDAPMVHIDSRRYSPRPVGEGPVKIYSNCESVELRLNGRSLGIRQAPDHVFVWEDVTLKPGANRLEAVGTKPGAKPCRDACTIVYKAAP